MNKSLRFVKTFMIASLAVVALVVAATFVGFHLRTEKLTIGLVHQQATALFRQVVLTRRLTLQAYAQLFTSYGSYGQFWEAAPRAGGIGFADLRPRPRPAPGDPADPFAFVGDPEFRTGALSVNAVLRWEYRLGSTFFLVYTRAQSEPSWDALDGPAPRTLRPWELGLGPTTDTILVKWSHRWGG